MFIVAFEKDGLNKKKETYDGSWRISGHEGLVGRVQTHVPDSRVDAAVAFSSCNQTFDV